MADLIDRDWVLSRMQFGPDADVVRMAPAVGAVPVVRCKDCEHRDPENEKCDCGCWHMAFRTHDDDYCSYGAKMDGGATGENA